MTFWLDAHLPPALAVWLNDHFDVDCHTLTRLGLSEIQDLELFEKARVANVVLITKDRDLIELVNRHGPPPQVVWVRLGNTSNARLKEAFASVFPDCLSFLDRGESVVEIRDA